MEKTPTTQCETLVIAPYFEDDAADQFCQELGKVLTSGAHLLIVDDGSIMRPFNESLLKQIGHPATVLYLHKNVGHQIAITSALDYAVREMNFEHVVILDSDGEDIPANIPILSERLKQFSKSDGHSDSTPLAVAATRKSRSESIGFKVCYWFYKLIFNALVGRHIRFGNFMVLNHAAAARLILLPETSMHVAGALISSRIPILEHPLDRGTRYAGESKMNLTSLTLHGLKAVMVFAETVLVRISLFCTLTALIIFAVLGIIGAMKFLGLFTPAWLSNVAAVLFIILLQIGLLSLLVLLSTRNFQGREQVKPAYSHLIKQAQSVS